MNKNNVCLNFRNKCNQLATLKYSSIQNFQCGTATVGKCDFDNCFFKGCKWGDVKNLCDAIVGTGGVCNGYGTGR